MRKVKKVKHRKVGNLDSGVNLTTGFNTRIKRTGDLYVRKIKKHERTNLLLAWTIQGSETN